MESEELKHQMELSLDRIRVQNLLSLANSVEEERRSIAQTADFDLQIDDEVEEIVSPLFTTFKTRNIFPTMTNFSEEQVMSLFRVMKSILPEFRKRGRKPSNHPMDDLLILLCHYKMGNTNSALAGSLGIKESALEDSINRTRPILNRTLTDIWYLERLRPVPIQGARPWIGLIVDTTSEEVFRPKARFEEAKRYWDEKNSLYALKKEVAIMASPPHYALFSQKGVVGSVHDFEIFKSNYTTYVDYLQKTLSERNSIPNDNDPRWGILGDKAYYTTEENQTTPLLRRIAVKRGAQGLELVANGELSRIRVKVECFFGRMKSLWAITRHCYRWDHKNFDFDFDNCLLLTNESIREAQLMEEDRTFFLQYHNDRRLYLEEKKRKEIEARNKYAARKRFRQSRS